MKQLRRPATCIPHSASPLVWLYKVNFLKKVLFQYWNFEINLHQLVKNIAKGPTIKVQNKTTKMYNLQTLKKNPDFSFVWLYQYLRIVVSRATK